MTPERRQALEAIARETANSECSNRGGARMLMQDTLRSIILDALLRAEQTHPQEAQPCTWTEDISSDFWQSACDETWCFNDAGPTENRVRFCHGCGKPVAVVPYTFKDGAEPQCPHGCPSGARDCGLCEDEGIWPPKPAQEAQDAGKETP